MRLPGPQDEAKPCPSNSASHVYLRYAVTLRLICASTPPSTSRGHTHTIPSVSYDITRGMAMLDAQVDIVTALALSDIVAMFVAFGNLRQQQTTIQAPRALIASAVYPSRPPPYPCLWFGLRASAHVPRECNSRPLQFTRAPSTRFAGVAIALAKKPQQ